jgi:putative endonuclease
MPSSPAARRAPRPRGSAAAPRSPINRSALGAAAEERAVAALCAAGYRIVERNVRLRRGELDIVAWDGDIFAFVEVRSRHDGRYGGASLAVPPRKRRQVIRTAQLYLATRSLAPPPRGFRFDVVAITGDELVLLRDAFRT